MLVYAVYAKSKIKLFRRDIIYETFVMKYIAFPFVFPSIFRRSTLGRRLLFARTFLTSAVLTFQRGWLSWNPYKQEILHGDLGDSGNAI